MKGANQILEHNQRLETIENQLIYITYLILSIILIILGACTLSVDSVISFVW